MLESQGKRRIRDYTHYNGCFQGKSHDLANKDIHSLSKSEISYLLREDKFTDVVLEIANRKLKNENIEINFFHHSSNSDEQRELIRELIIVNDKYWDLYPKILNSVKSEITEFLPTIMLPDCIKEHFKNYSPNELVWGEKENEWYNNMIHHDAAITVMSAYGRIRQLKRAIKHGTEIRYNLKNESIIICNEELFHNLLVKNLLNNKQILEYINKEITIDY